MGSKEGKFRKVVARCLSAPGGGQAQQLLSVISLSPRTFLCLRDPHTHALYRSSRAVVDPKLKTLTIPCLLLAYLILWTITFIGVTRLITTSEDKILVDWIYFGGCLAAMTCLSAALLIICLGRRWRCAQVREKTQCHLEATEEHLRHKADLVVEMAAATSDAEEDQVQVVLRQPCTIERIFIDVCCSQTILVVAFLSFVMSIIALRIWTLHDEAHVRRMRVMEFFIAINAFGCHVFILGIFLLSRSLYLSARTCAYLFLAHLVLILVTPLYSVIVSGYCVMEELAFVFLTMVVSAVAFVNEIRAELLRQFIFCSALKAVNISKVSLCDATTTTGMEQVLAHLSQISRLAIMASASCPGSLRHTENAVQILVYVAECQRMLTRYNELFKVRVVGGPEQSADLPIVEYAKMYGIDVGQQQPSASQRLGREGRLALSSDTIKRFSMTSPLPSFDMRDALLNVVERESQRATTRLSGNGTSVTKSNFAGTGEVTSKTQSLPPTESDASAPNFIRPEVPTRVLTSKIASLVGTRWTVDFFKLNAECNGNILFEVGYTLLAEDITGTVRHHSSFIDPLLKDTPRTQNLCDPSRDSERVAELQLHMYLNFLSCLQKQYRSLPYHNGVHGAHVAHSMACLQRYLGLSDGSSWDMSIRFASLLAAMGHDLGHPGRNNSYLMNTYDPLTVIYNDLSVLENYHSCLLFMTLELENCNVLFPFTSEVFRLMRELIIRLILATDMKSHYEQLARFRLRRNNNDFSPSNELNDLKLVLELCIKVSDLAASACEWDVHLEWCYRVAEEFYRQGEEEMKAGLPLSPLCDRAKHFDEFPKSQIGFIEFVTAPLFLELCALSSDQGIINRLHETILQNKSRWVQLAESRDVEIPFSIQRIISHPDEHRKRLGHRRWTSVVGDFGQDSPLNPLVEPERRDRRQSSDTSRDGGEEVTSSLGDIMSTSSWEDESFAGDGDKSSRRMSSWSERRPRKGALKRDSALSPSARVKGIDTEWQAPNVLEVVKRRASILHVD